MYSPPDNALIFAVISIIVGIILGSLIPYPPPLILAIPLVIVLIIIFYSNYRIESKINKRNKNESIQQEQSESKDS